MSNLPCLAHKVPCPYLDRSGKESAWTCCGEARKVQRLMTMRECPSLDVARAAYRKMKQEAKGRGPCEV